MAKPEAARITSKFISHLETDMYARLPVELHHYKLARDWIALFKWNLRTLDALHLAVASSEDMPAREAVDRMITANCQQVTNSRLSDSQLDRQPLRDVHFS